MRVAVHYNATADGARETVRDVERAGGSGQVFRADLSRGDAERPLVDDVVKQFGGLDVLVNSAAVMVRTPFGSIDAAQWDRHHGRQPARAVSRGAGRGAASEERRAARSSTSPISRRSRRGPAIIPHGISKSGVVTMTRALARMLAPEVRVAGVAPGTVLLPDNWAEDDAERMRTTTPLQRNGSPADVTATVLFILDSDYLTGETIIVDGGRHVRK